MKERRNWKSLCRRLYRKALADCFLAEHEGSETPLYEDERKAFAGASSAPELDLRLAARGF